ncbi:unnamed protein product, partial [marine sediment metagenome]
PDVPTEKPVKVTKTGGLDHSDRKSYSSEHASS